MKDNDGQQLAYVHFDDPRSAAKPLTRDADVRLGDRSAVVRQRNAGWHLGRIYAENVAGRPMQPDVMEVGTALEQLRSSV